MGRRDICETGPKSSFLGEKEESRFHFAEWAGFILMRHKVLELVINFLKDGSNYRN